MFSKRKGLHPWHLHLVKIIWIASGNMHWRICAISCNVVSTSNPKWLYSSIAYKKNSGHTERRRIHISVITVHITPEYTFNQAVPNFMSTSLLVNSQRKHATLTDFHRVNKLPVEADNRILRICIMMSSALFNPCLEKICFGDNFFLSISIHYRFNSGYHATGEINLVHRRKENLWVWIEWVILETTEVWFPLTTRFTFALCQVAITNWL